jgi:hypothetical protein
VKVSSAFRKQQDNGVMDGEKRPSFWLERQHSGLMGTKLFVLGTLA